MMTDFFKLDPKLEPTFFEVSSRMFSEYEKMIKVIPDLDLDEFFDEYEDVYRNAIRRSRAEPLDTIAYDDDISKHSEIMTVDDWVACCESGCFIDYDGYGYPVRNDKCSNVLLKPSIRHLTPKDATHIAWFNRIGYIMVIKKTSWHYKLNTFVWGKYHLSEDFCKYWWSTLASILAAAAVMSAITFLAIAFSYAIYSVFTSTEAAISLGIGLGLVVTSAILATLVSWVIKAVNKRPKLERVLKYVIGYPAIGVLCIIGLPYIVMFIVVTLIISAFDEGIKYVKGRSAKSNASDSLISTKYKAVKGKYCPRIEYK